MKPRIFIECRDFIQRKAGESKLTCLHHEDLIGNVSQNRLKAGYRHHGVTAHLATSTHAMKTENTHVELFLINDMVTFFSDLVSWCVKFRSWRWYAALDIRKTRHCLKTYGCGRSCFEDGCLHNTVSYLSYSFLSHPLAGSKVRGSVLLFGPQAPVDGIPPSEDRLTSLFQGVHLPELAKGVTIMFQTSTPH